MEPIIFTIDTNCNNTSIDTLVEGLPPGVDYYLYLTPYEKELVLYGVPFIPGSFEVNLIITDTKNGAQQALSGRIIVENDCEETTRMFEYNFKKTHDPAERYEKINKFLSLNITINTLIICNKYFFSIKILRNKI